MRFPESFLARGVYMHELEKKWILYKREKYKKAAILFASFFGVAASSFYISYLIFGTDKNSNIVKTPQIIEQNLSSQRQQETQTILQNAAKEIVIVSSEAQNEKFKSFEPQATQEVQIKGAQQTEVSPPPKAEPAPKIYIETKETNQTLLFEERFKKNGDFESALALSEEYYKNEEYQKALKWAISANSIDSKNEKSWVLFAKASAKLGRKQNAENALENFARTSGSENIKTLLRQIKAGEI